MRLVINITSCNGKFIVDNNNLTLELIAKSGLEQDKQEAKAKRNCFSNIVSSFMKNFVQNKVTSKELSDNENYPMGPHFNPSFCVTLTFEKNIDLNTIRTLFKNSDDDLIKLISKDNQTKIINLCKLYFDHPLMTHTLKVSVGQFKVLKQVQQANAENLEILRSFESQFNSFPEKDEGKNLTEVLQTNLSTRQCR